MHVFGSHAVVDVELKCLMATVPQRPVRCAGAVRTKQRNSVCIFRSGPYGLRSAIPKSCCDAGSVVRRSSADVHPVGAVLDAPDDEATVREQSSHNCIQS
jgi:hypothetical protein